MPDSVDFEVRVEPASHDLYRRDWVPGPDVGLAGMWLGAVVTDAAGQGYWGLRGADDFLVGMTHVVSPVTGFKPIPDRFDPNPPHLFPEYSSIDWFEPMQLVDSDELVQLSYYSGRFERNADGLHWYDATGRWEIHGKNASDVFIVHVPKQDGLHDEVYYRHELLKATGTVNGTEVSGYLHQDYAYGPDGRVYPELPVASSLQGLWFSWLHQHEDGEWGGGSFWQGRDDIAFGPGYQVKNGVTTAHDDIVATPTFNQDGQMTELSASIGKDSYVFTFDRSASPIHYFGQVTDCSSGNIPARSWCWGEYTGGMLTPEVLKMVMAPFDLARGRTSFE